MNQKYITNVPSNPMEVDVVMKAFIEKWNTKQHKHTHADQFIDEIVKNYITTENIWNNSYDHILLLLLGEITRYENMILSSNIKWGENDLEGCISSMNEYKTLLSIFE